MGAWSGVVGVVGIWGGGGGGGGVSEVGGTQLETQHTI